MIILHFHLQPQCKNELFHILHIIMMYVNISHRRRSRGTGGAVAPQTEIGGAPPSTFWCRKTLLPMYLTITLTSARTFSAFRRLKNYLRSTMNRGGGAVAPQTEIGGALPPPHVLVPKNTIADVFDNNFDISAHIFCPQTTQELPKKHNEEGTPEQQPTDALSQIDYGHQWTL